MCESSKKAILAVIQTLNQIYVSGRDNLDMLLASIIALETVLKSEKGGEDSG